MNTAAERRRLGECLAALDPDPSRAGVEFEQVAAWWLTADPVWASRVAQVWRWTKWPQRPGDQDLGIDLVVELVGGGLMAVQVKHRTRVSTAEIDSFLAAAAGGPFNERMLLATTDDVAANGRKKLRAAGAHIVTRGDLDASQVSWPDGTDLTGAGREPPRVALGHQTAAIGDTVAALEVGDRCRLTMACGSGKTLVAQRAAETIAGTGLVLVAVPSLSLLKQTLESWARDSLTVGGLADWLAVCSDRTVADAPDPSEMPTVTTDLAAVAAWLIRRKARDRQRVLFTTHASMPVVAEALKTANRTADLLVVDEAHRVAGRGQLASLATGAFPAKRRVFLTATPRIYTAAARAQADGEGVEVVSMDDDERFGPEAHHLSFAAAVDAGLLCDFEIVVSIITDADTARLVDQRVLAELGGVQNDTATLASHLAVARAAHDWDARRTISFHTRIAQAYSFAQDHPRLAQLVDPGEVVAAEATSGAVPAGARKAALDRLAGLVAADRRLLANARVLSEGVDVPSVDAVTFIDPKRSVIDIAQAVGRAMRTAPGKTRGLVIVPVHLPSGAGSQGVADASAWKPVWDTLRALRSIDERLAEELDRYRYQLGRRSGPAEPPTRLHFHYVEVLDARFIESVTVEAVRRTTASWEERFGQLGAYVDGHGTSFVPKAFLTSDGFRLNRWVLDQRSLRKKGRMAAERQARLDALPGWTWDPHEAAWEDGYAHLVAFADDHGTSRVPQSYVTHDGCRLGGWVAAQRRAGRQGRSFTQQARLDGLPDWTWDALEAAWDDGYARLVAYIDEHGTSAVPRNYVTHDGYRLGLWVRGQRRGGRRRRSSTQQERLDALPDWTWDPPLESAWEDGYAHLVAYIDKHGSSRLPRSHVTADGYRLGQWVGVQRRAYRQGKLSAERQGRLDPLPDWTWDPNESAWEDGYARLVAYIDEHDTSLVPLRYVTADGFHLGQWAQAQRTARRMGTIPLNRRERLDALPEKILDPREVAWEDGYARLVAYTGEHGTSRVPQSYVTPDGYTLGRWALNQQKTHRQGKISAERQERLDALPNWTWGPNEAAWEDGYAHLVAFAEEHGTSGVTVAHVTADGYRLGQWVGVQRRAYRQGKMSAERQERLDALPNWTWGPNEAAWEDGYAHLVAFAEEHGTSGVTVAHVTADGYRLGQWVGVQRRAYRQGKMSAERQERLLALPDWTWGVLEAASDDG